MRVPILLIVLLSFVSPARAQDPDPDPDPDPDEDTNEDLIVEENAKHKAAELSAYARIGSHGGFGPGVQFAVPIAPRGFLDTLNDAFFIEFGVDFMWAGLILPGFSTAPYLVVAPMGGVKWMFYITEAFAAFSAVKGGAYVSTDASTLGSLSTPLFEWTFGGVLNLNDKIGIRFEAGYPAVRIGVQIALE